MAGGRGKTLCLFSAKGGVGKTVTALNLAGVFESLKKRVLLVDLALYGGGINVALNVVSEKSIYHLADDLNNNRYKDFNSYITKYDEFIDILSAPKDPRMANKIDSKYVELILDRAEAIYDIILIDTNHVLNEINLVALDRVDSILFVITNDPFDLKNMKSIISIFKDLDINKFKILLNNSEDPYKNYFSSYDLKQLLKSNIDYVLSSNMHIKNMDNYIMNGKIVSLDKKIAFLCNKDYKVLVKIAKDNLDKEGDVR